MNQVQPEFLQRFLTYIHAIKGQSAKTTQEYFLDIRLFLRYIVAMKIEHKKEFIPETIDISGVTIEQVKKITTDDIYQYLTYLSTSRPKNRFDSEQTGIESKAIARKISAIRTFFKYLKVQVHLLEHDPAENIETPKTKKTLPRHLSVDEAASLLDIVTGANKERDYCILTLFLNCGMRVSELVNIDINDIKNDTIIITGKGNKERTVYLNAACIDAINRYIPARIDAKDAKKALFTTRQNSRISASTVKWLVKKYIGLAGLDQTRYSAHKLRHTAATLMYQNGVDVLVLQNILGHENLNTTKIYTHIDNKLAREAVERNPLGHIKKDSE